MLLVLFFFGRALLDQAPDMLRYHWELDPTYLAVAFVLIIVRGPLGAYGWWAIMQQLGCKLLWWRSVRILYYSAMAGYLPGGMWHAVGRVYLAEKEGAPRSVTTVSVVIESALNTLAASIVAPLSLIAWRDFPVWTAAIAFAILLGFVLQPQVPFRFLNWALVRVGRQPLDIKLSPRDMLRLLWPYVVNWLLFGIMSFALVAALYPKLPLEYAPVLAGVFTAAWLIGYLAIFVPQGLVVREAIMISFMTGFAGLPIPVATAAAVLSRLWSIFGVAIWGAISTRL